MITEVYDFAYVINYGLNDVLHIVGHFFNLRPAYNGTSYNVFEHNKFSGNTHGLWLWPNSIYSHDNRNALPKLCSEHFCVALATT